MLIDSEELGEEEVLEDMKQTFEYRREQNRLNIGFDHSAEWIYKKINKEIQPTITRQTEIALVEDIEMGRDGCMRK